MPDQHKVRIYRSKNLRQWEFASEFGPRRRGLEASGNAPISWELTGSWTPPASASTTPTSPGTNVKPLAAQRQSQPRRPGPPGSADQYFVGQFDGFRLYSQDHPGSGPRWADWGKDFYASTSFTNIPSGHDADQDRVWIAWMSDWQYASKLPSLPGRGEMTMARHIFLRQESDRPALTPEEESLVLVQKPILPIPADKRYTAMFGGPRFEPILKANADLAAHKAVGNVYRLRFTLDPGEAAESGVRLRRSAANPDDPADGNRRRH